MKTKNQPKPTRRSRRQLTHRNLSTAGAMPHDTNMPALPGATPHEFLSFAFYPGAIESLAPVEYPTAV